MNYDFSGLESVFSGKVPVKNDYENVYAVEVISSFKEVYLVKADSTTNLMQNIMGIIDSGEATYFQDHIGYNVSNVSLCKSDSDYVDILKRTEQPSMTLEQFTSKRTGWLRHIHHIKET